MLSDWDEDCQIIVFLGKLIGGVIISLDQIQREDDRGIQMPW